MSVKPSDSACEEAVRRLVAEQRRLAKAATNFTREDVRFLRMVAEDMRQIGLSMTGADDIADRIEALLPPGDE